MNADARSEVSEILGRAEGTLGLPIRLLHGPTGTVEQRLAHVELRLAMQRKAIELLAERLDELRKGRGDPPPARLVTRWGQSPRGTLNAFSVAGNDRALRNAARPSGY